jgi:microsomal dipeptidase-like Zn-dependent dipeptidase
MYVDWVYRAYRHGLRLLVVVITNSEALCKLTHRRPDAPCDGSGVVSRQLNLIHSMVERIRAEEGGWLQLARHADEAEEIVADNRLALVIGVEIDTPFGCAHESDPSCRRDAYTDELNDWYERGVRQINPVHLIDNGFGGAAIYDERMNVSQHFLRGTYLDRDPAGCADPAIDYELQGRAGVPTALWLLPALQTFRGYDPRYDPSPAGQEGHCNARGLSEDGVGLVRELMARGMLIDIDHLSEKSIDEILAIAREPCRSPTGCYPLMAGHSWFRDLKFRLPEGSGIYHEETAELEEALELTTELQKSSRTLDAIGELGGVVGVMTNHGPVSRHGDAVPNDCDTSSKSLAQALLYAVDQMNGRGGVGLGTDFNGLVGQTGPRFGAFACGSREGDATLPVQARQENRLHYPFESYFGESVPCNRAGDRSFDFNEDGLAHYGLLPDLIADLEGVGLPRPALDTLFGSANAYVKMWRQAEKYRERRD